MYQMWNFGKAIAYLEPSMTHFFSAITPCTFRVAVNKTNDREELKMSVILVSKLKQSQTFLWYFIASVITLVKNISSEIIKYLSEIGLKRLEETEYELPKYGASAPEVYVCFKSSSCIYKTWTYSTAQKSMCSYFIITHFLLYSTLCFTFSSPQCNNTIPLHLLSVFFSLVDRTLTWQNTTTLNLINARMCLSSMLQKYLQRTWANSMELA